LRRSGDIEEFDFLDLLDLLRARWLLIAGFVLAVCVLAIGYVVFARPVYRSTVVLISTSSERNGLGGALASTLGSLGGLGTLAGLNIGNDSSVEEALAVLRSRRFGESFINDFNLMPRFFAPDWDEQRKVWTTRADRQPTPAQAFIYFDRRVRSVNHDKRTGLTSLHIDWYDPDEAATWANEIAKRLNTEMRQRAIKNATASIAFLQGPLPEADNLESRAAVSRLLEAQIKQRMLATVTEDYAFRIVDGAMPADRTRPLRPPRLTILGAAPFIGLVLGVLAALALNFLRRTPARSI
jgi:uncharacterized protein involved in exopolysaccharide biosynthesis